MEAEERKETEAADMPETKAHRPVAPFLGSKETTGTIMKDVVIALAPAALFGVYRFGFRAFLILLLSVTSCVLAEHICKRIRKTPNGGYECSAVVTGLLFGMMLPADVPYWIPVAGGVFSIVVIKMLFGGLGRNLLNPAATGKCLFLILTGFLMKETTNGYGDVWKTGSLSELFFGFGEGMIGEVSVFLLLLGGLYLVACRVISFWPPLLYLLVFGTVLAVFGADGFVPEVWVRQFSNGSVVLGAFFLLNDVTTSPMTKAGRVLHAVLVGGLTGALYVSGYRAEAVPFAILCGNLPVRLLDKLTFPRVSGKGKKAK